MLYLSVVRRCCPLLRVASAVCWLMVAGAYALLFVVCWLLVLLCVVVCCCLFVNVVLFAVCRY